ncbi:MAG: hypothetical protein H6822_12200 [Planctomycetaceae bacterium]|nr:hypothetical protein [Planctomycetales bacterium]MCB9922939.1 hypothetical protein [Planctomycetaceae bacterium]
MEKRRAQLEAKKASPKPSTSPTPPRSKIEKPLSALVDLPDPEPPPIAAEDNKLGRKLDQSSARPQPARELAPLESSPGIKNDDSHTSKKPPPLPSKRAIQRETPRPEPTKAESAVEQIDDDGAPSLSSPNNGSRHNVQVTELLDAELSGNLTGDDAEITVSGYVADRDKVATVRWLAVTLAIAGLVGMVPAIIDVTEHWLSPTSGGVSRWACVLMLVALIQSAYALYLIQLPDWSSVWVVTFFTLAIAGSYAAMFGLTLLSTDQGEFVQLLGLADRLRGGKATLWCLIMLSLMSLISYFSGRVGVRWRSVFVA